MRKKLISSIIFIVIFSLCLQFPALAAPASPTGLSTSDYNQIYTQLNAFSSSPFSSSNNLKIGEPIPTYSFASQNLTETNFTIYPIFSSQNIPFLALKVKLDDGNYTIQLAENALPELSTYINEDIAIIYDSAKRHIVSDGIILSSVSFPTQSFSTDLLTAQSLDSALSVTNISYKTSNTVYSLNSTTQIYPRDPYITLAVPQKAQTWSYLCWAACTASIAQYLTGTPHSDYVIAQQVADSMVVTEYNVRREPAEVAGILTDYTNVTYTAKLFIPGQQRIYNNLVAGYPVVGCFVRTSDSAKHAVVIRGIYMDTRIVIMDPDYGGISGTITVSSSSETYTYVRPDTGSTYRLYGFISVS